jgi:hypothetical protein
MTWYNPKTGCEEEVPTPSTDEEAFEMFCSDLNSRTFVPEYARLREEGMSVEQGRMTARRY